MPLTTKAIEAAQPKAKLYKLDDADGLVLAIHPSGGKHWRLKYRFGGKETTLSLGSYPTVSLPEARRLRDDTRKLLAEGRDPLAARNEARYRPPRRAGAAGASATVFQLSLVDDGSLVIRSKAVELCLNAQQVAALRQFLSVPIPAAEE
jgi:Arm DNA-binding domain